VMADLFANILPYLGIKAEISEEPAEAEADQ